MANKEVLSRLILAGAFLLGGRTTLAATIFDVTLDTAPLVGHPAGLFSIFLVFTDGDGTGNENNVVTMDNIAFDGGSAVGSPVVFGDVDGSLTSGVTIIDSSFLSLFSEQFVPGPSLSLSLGLTLNDNASGTPDRLTFSIVDSFGVSVPTLAPFGDYFLGVDLVSTGPIIEAYGSDVSRSPTLGDPVSINAPGVIAVNPIPEPSTIYLLGSALGALVAVKVRSLLRCS